MIFLPLGSTEEESDSPSLRMLLGSGRVKDSGIRPATILGPFKIKRSPFRRSSSYSRNNNNEISSGSASQKGRGKSTISREILIRGPPDMMSASEGERGGHEKRM